MPDLLVEWAKDIRHANWHRLLELNVSSVTGAGVYLIWHSGTAPNVVYAGKGNLAERLRKHQSDSDILRFGERGTLLVSWGIVPSHRFAGVERYLIEYYRPALNKQVPETPPVAVNPLVW